MNQDYTYEDIAKMIDHSLQRDLTCGVQTVRCELRQQISDSAITTEAVRNVAEVAQRTRLVPLQDVSIQVVPIATADRIDEVPEVILGLCLEELN